MRRKRQVGEAVNPRIRAVYQGGERVATTGIKRLPTSAAAMATINSKSHVFQQAELHDEYFKLVDVVSELKSTCQLEQERRVKAIARVRRLEEIVVLKDRKIESLLHARSVTGNYDVMSSNAAQRDRQQNTLIQKLRQKIAQQAQILGGYEEALQTLRSSSKSTNLVELEEERGQLYQEIYRLQALLDRQRQDMVTQGEQANVFADVEANYNDQIAKLLQENKKLHHEKHKCEQNVISLKAVIETLQQQLALEQRKRTYDLQVGTNAHVLNATPSSPNRMVVLSRAIEDMKVLLRKESAASIPRDKLKSPRSSTPSVAKPDRAPAAAVARNDDLSAAPKAPKTMPQSRIRPQSARSTRAKPTPPPLAPVPKAEQCSKQITQCHEEKKDATPTAQIEAPNAIVDEKESHMLSPFETTLTEVIDQPDEEATHPDNSNGIDENLQPAIEVLPSPADTAATTGECSTPDSVSNDAVSEAERNKLDESHASSSDNSALAKEIPFGEQGVPEMDIAASEVHRQKLADVERMLREVEDDIENDAASDSSEEFLEIAQLQESDSIDHLVGGIGMQNQGYEVKPSEPPQNPSPTLLPSSSLSSTSSSSTSTSSSASSSSSSSSESPSSPSDSSSSLSLANAQSSSSSLSPSDEVQASTATNRGAVVVEVKHVRGYEDGYQSDFTEGDQEEGSP